MTNESEKDTARYLWMAGAVGTGACLALWLSRKRGSLDEDEKELRQYGEGHAEEMEPWMRSAAKRQPGSALHEGYDFVEQ